MNKFFKLFVAVALGLVAAIALSQNIGGGGTVNGNTWTTGTSTLTGAAAGKYAELVSDGTN